MNESILVVDDDERILRTFARHLRRAGHDVFTASSGTLAIQVFAQKRPEIVFTDVRMPPPDGFAVLRAIRAQAEEAEVILITGHSDMNMAIEALRNGASDFVPKPIDPATLNAVLQRAQDRLRLKRELRESEERYRALVESSADHIFMLANDGTYVASNDQVSQFGLASGQELIGRHLSEVYLPELAHLYQKRLGEVWATNRAVVFEHPMPEPDRQIHHHVDTLFPIVQNGRVWAVGGTCRDITERVRAERTLQHRNRGLTLLNRVGQELTATLDPAQVIEQLLKAGIDVIGARGASVWLWDEERGDRLVCRSFFHQDQGRIPVNLHLHPGQGVAGWVVETGKSALVSYAPEDSRFFPGIDEQTSFRTTSLLAVPLWVRGKVIGVLEMVNKLQGPSEGTRVTFDDDDRTLVETLAASAAIAIDNARLVETLRQHTAELETRNTELDAFAHTVAHDLKNPLNIVVGYAALLKQECTTISRKELCTHMATIERNGLKMNSIIYELLLLAGVRQMEAEIVPLDTGSIVSEALQRLGLLIEEYRPDIILPETWPTVVGYGPWVEEVWANYLSNAIKYGGRPPRVELGFSIADSQSDERQPPMVRFWIRDNGPGLAPEEQERLFTPFTRLDQVSTKGHGLGLSIVRRIVEKLGGQIGVESVPGQGSVFSFTLPSAVEQV